MQQNAWQLLPPKQGTLQLPPELAGMNPAARLEALQRMREALNAQVEQLDDARGELAEQRRGEWSKGIVDKGLEARIAALDARITATQSQIQLVDQEIVSATALAPGRVKTIAETRVQQGPPPGSFPEELIAIPVLFILCVGLPLSIAFARRIWRRAGDIGAGIPKEFMERLNRMDQNIDAIALEVERIGENQRFLTKQTERERANLKG